MAIQINKIESAIMEFPNGSKVPVGKYINLPITWERVLDETHGTAKVLMTDMRQSEFDQYSVRIDAQFKVNIPIEIKFAGQETLIRMIVARDTAEMTRKDGWETWSHNIEFVDEVKKLEQEPVDNLTFKNAIPRTYDADIDATWYTKSADSKYLFWTSALAEAETNYWTPPAIKGLFQKGEILISDNASTFKTSSNTTSSLHILTELTLIVTTPSGEQKTYSSSLAQSGTGIKATYLSTTHAINLTLDGEYRLEFRQKWWYQSSYYDSDLQMTITHNTTYSTSVETWIYVGELNNAAFQPYTIKTVIDRILDVTPTRTANGVNKYAFRNNAEEYATEESPEFTFTGKHLFEVMLDIASYKKMFPALYKNEIYFRPFWNGEMLTSGDLPPPTKAVLSSAIDQYCTALDSYVENMVCINDTNVGTVVEPYKNGYISARSNSGSEISETTSVIPTQSTIYQPISLNVGETDGVVVGDIQAYLYEQEDYEALSDTSAAYPYSKGYALKYTRFSKNYTELSHRIKTSDVIADALTKPALANIIGATTNGAVGDAGLSLKDYLSAFIGKDTAAPFADLLFQPTYIPVVNARVRQYKPMISAEDYEATLFYNQQSEVVDSEAFGEHVKGLVQKLGNHTEIRVYRFERVDDIPTVGTLIDEKSVYNVAMTIYENHVDATICLVDYAELSTYIGVKNEIKTSDISSTKWCNRFINWEEFLVFTHEAYTGNTLSITKDALADIVSFTTAEPLTCAMFTSYAESGDSIMTAFAPIKHLALGNSIYFQWEMLDNFAVGDKFEKAPSGATSAWTGTQYDRAQRAVRYCDSFGRMEKLDFQLLKTGPTPDNAGWLITEEDLSWTVDESAETITFKLKNKYPCYIIVWYQGEFVDPYGWGVPSLIFEPNQTSVSASWGWTADETQFNGASVYDGYYSTDETEKAKIAALAERYIRAQIAHEYPQKPNALNFAPSSWNSDEEKRPAFQLYDWLIKKNSAEALKFAAQYHFRQTWREFVIGSGMSNFCALVGGSCSQLQMFISALPINRFERHINLGDTYNYLVLDDLPTFTVDEDNKRVEITLPSSVNDYIDVTKSWGLVGIDKNGNRQLIFGENKNAQNEAFLTTFYLVAMQKNNEPQARATYTLTVADTTSHEESVSFSFYVDGVSYGRGDLEFPRGVEITVKNTHVRGFYFVLDGTSTWIGYQKSFTFKLTKDMEYYAWDTYVSPTDPMPV